MPLDAVFAGDEFASLSSRPLSGVVDRGSAEATLLAALGEPVPVRVNASRLRELVGDMEGLAIVAEDMRSYTKLKELNARNATLLDDKRILLAEVHHGIKSNMSTIRAVLNLQMESTRYERARETLADAGSRVVIVIRDDGPGIPSSFDFGESTGFGLTMTRAMTDRLGGSLSASGENGTK